MLKITNCLHNKGIVSTFVLERWKGRWEINPLTHKRIEFFDLGGVLVLIIV